MNFRLTTTLAAIVCAMLSLTLLVVPGLIFWLFQLDANVATEVMARRAGVLFFGLTILTYGLRDLPEGKPRQTVALGIGATMFLLAILGLIEFVMGRIGPGVFLAIAAELAFTALFAREAFSRA